jgi:YggT family protein
MSFSDLLANFLKALAHVLDIGLYAYSWVIIISALISWVNPDPYNPIVRFLYSVTEPVYRPIRKRLNLGLPIDISPLIVLLAIYFLRLFLVQSLMQIAAGL